MKMYSFYSCSAMKMYSCNEMYLFKLLYSCSVMKIYSFYSCSIMKMYSINLVNWKCINSFSVMKMHSPYSSSIKYYVMKWNCTNFTHVVQKFIHSTQSKLGGCWCVTSSSKQEDSNLAFKRMQSQIQEIILSQIIH